jgi:TolB protein
MCGLLPLWTGDLGMMTKNNDLLLLTAALVLFCGFLFLLVIVLPGFRRLSAASATPTIDLFATLAATTPGKSSGGAAAAATAVTFDETLSGSSVAGEPGGKIAFTCQLHKYQSTEQICIINADGSGWKQLTQEDGFRHYYPSISPEGTSVVYSAFRETNVYEIYEVTLNGITVRLTDRLGVLTAPEISPDGRLITFMRWTEDSDQYQVWVMDRDGGNPRQVVSGSGWDPTWSPDGTRLLFASDRSGQNQLWVVNLDGTGLKQITSLLVMRGRSDWSPADQIVTYSGEPWNRELFIMEADGSNSRQLTPTGGNSQGPSFSPDGKWVAFTAYFDQYSDIHGCEIYIIRVDGTGLRRLTENTYCDYQPRWGP